MLVAGHRVAGVVRPQALINPLLKGSQAVHPRTPKADGENGRVILDEPLPTINNFIAVTINNFTDVVSRTLPTHILLPSS